MLQRLQPDAIQKSVTRPVRGKVLERIDARNARSEACDRIVRAAASVMSGWLQQHGRRVTTKGCRQAIYSDFSARSALERDSVERSASENAASVASKVGITSRSVCNQASARFVTLI